MLTGARNRADRRRRTSIAGKEGFFNSSTHSICSHPRCAPTNYHPPRHRPAPTPPRLLRSRHPLLIQRPKAPRARLGCPAPGSQTSHYEPHFRSSRNRLNACLYGDIISFNRTSDSVTRPLPMNLAAAPADTTRMAMIAKACIL